jgi:catechol 2,3-dioxygenase-like lactoylglutathione lyase family enzyme
MADARRGPTHGALDGSTYMAFIPVRDVAAARSFYVGVLGLACLEESPFAIVVDAHGTRLRLTPVPELRAQPFTIAGWEVPDIDASVDALAAAGVALQRFDGIEQDGRGVWHTPGGDRVAWFSDPDGNTLSLTTFAHR